MLASPAATALAHGATGTWLDEFVELGLPLIIFVILYFWSSRSGKDRRAGTPPGRAADGDGTGDGSKET